MIGGGPRKNDGSSGGGFGNDYDQSPVEAGSDILIFSIIGFIMSIGSFATYFNMIYPRDNGSNYKAMLFSS